MLFWLCLEPNFPKIQIFPSSDIVVLTLLSYFLKPGPHLSKNTIPYNIFVLTITCPVIFVCNKAIMFHQHVRILSTWNHISLSCQHIMFSYHISLTCQHYAVLISENRNVGATRKCLSHDLDLVM